MYANIGHLDSADTENELVAGLDALEYQSMTGLASLSQSCIGYSAQVRRRHRRLQATVGADVVMASTGINHTRWRTHRPPTDANAHPHANETRQAAAIHTAVWIPRPSVIASWRSETQVKDVALCGPPTSVDLGDSDAV